MPRLRRIMHATDFSRASSAALRRAIALAKADGARLDIVHVMTPPSLALPADGYVSPQLYTDLEASARAQARKRLDAVVVRARKAGVRAGGLLLEGVPHERIVRAARARKAGLLVIGTHGRTGLARFFLGSVAARLISSASVPVLTVRGRG
jgi:nucleotide-binding universal stress UspA family protein